MAALRLMATDENPATRTIAEDQERREALEALKPLRTHDLSSGTMGAVESFIELLEFKVRRDEL